MPESRAIFVSYAHEDAASARKIVEALRAFGIEVWFDANELRGGDQWDANIRRQIKACGLFLPIVSDTTQKRREAYFRLEWKLADDRTHLMAPGTPFIVPVVIDHTPEYEAAVPDSFTKAQFTRLPNGDPTPEFISQVKKLATDSPAAQPTRTPSTARTSTDAGAPSKAGATQKRNLVLPIVAMSIVGILAAVLGVTWMGRPTATENPVDATSAENTPREVASVPATTDRLSIAVLPFTNMSDDPAANSFFADGIHEDLLTNLSYIAELKVVSRTSVMQYRDTTKPIKQIASELGVGTLLEGSVRRAGDQVRVTAQLIDASADEHIWAQNYDRKLEDIFAIQGELARSITDALRVALTDEQAEAFADRPTKNLEAYELFLKEQELQEREGNTPERQFQSIAMMQKAVELDPNFAHAWANLAVLHAQEYFWERDTSDTRRELASRAIERALTLAPTDLDVMTYAGSYHYYAYRNYTRAAEYYQKVLDVAPNHVDAIASMGFIRRREGKWAESINHLEKALQLDPRNNSVIIPLIESYTRLRQWHQAVTLQQILVDQNPGDIEIEGQLAGFQAELDGSYQPFQDLVDRYPDLAESDHPVFFNIRLQRAVVNRDWDRILELQRGAPTLVKNSPGFDFTAVLVLKITGREDEATTLLEKMRDEAKRALEANNNKTGYYFLLAMVVSLLGDVEEGQRIASLYEAHLREKNDALDMAFAHATFAVISVWVDSPDVAIEHLRNYLRKTAFQIFSRYKLTDELWLHPLWGTPELEALLQDDEAWAPPLAD